MLIGAGADIDDVVIALEPLIGAGVPQMGPGLFQHRDDLLAAPRGRAADDAARAAVDELAAKPGIGFGIALGIANNRLELERQLAGAVDLRDRRQRPEIALAPQRGIGPLAREQYADRDRAHAHQWSSQTKTPHTQNAAEAFGVGRKCPRSRLNTSMMVRTVGTSQAAPAQLLRDPPQRLENAQFGKIATTAIEKQAANRAVIFLFA